MIGEKEILPSYHCKSILFIRIRHSSNMSFHPSFWERESVFSRIDITIIGGGIVGLSAAIFIRERNPKLKVMVVERGFLPYGASTRNAGFACFGSMTELLSDLKTETEQEVLERVKLRWQGLHLLRGMLGDEAIGFEPLGGYELFAENDLSAYNNCMDQLGRFNRMLSEITQRSETFQTADDQLATFGFHGIRHLIKNTCEGQIDTGIMMLALEKKAADSGVRIINGLEIAEIHDRGNACELLTRSGFSFQSGKCLVANNGFARQLLPELAVDPARAQVLMTHPIEQLKVRGTFHYDEGFYYFRNVGDRVLFGGGRNLDFQGEQTTEFGLTDTIQQRLEQLLTEVILPGQSFQVDMRWSGIMGVGTSKSTILKPLSNNLFCAVRMGGMGIAIGSMIGRKAADMILGDA